MTALKFRILSIIPILFLLTSTQGAEPGKVFVSDFLPENYVTDGSVSYQSELQQALDATSPGETLCFPPMTYLLEHEAGLKLHSRLNLNLEGARFLFPADAHEDGQAFVGEDIEDLKIKGGEIIGRNDVWPAGINIRGIYLTGKCQRIHIEEMFLHDLTSNGIGLFGNSDEEPAHDIRVINTIIDNCCNIYGDYMAPPNELHGPEKGSVREDQGSVAFYYVESFQVRGCRMDRSRSDGTHFYHCRNGQICQNEINRSKMGGFFLEGCHNVLASDNIIRQNGSRGCTIERGSHNCTLIGNLVEESGREGLWIPDSQYCLISKNIFRRNGRKPNGPEPHQRWNANITINQSKHDPSHTVSAHCLFSENLIETTSEQIAAIRVNLTEESQSMVIHNNVLTGVNQSILIEGAGDVIKLNNVGSNLSGR
ncbi:MAG: right-handed parallel beta-helix repeat-containing protein [Planctomycetaceae bacterium]